MDYESSVEEVDEITRQISVSIPADIVTQHIDVEIGNICKTAKVKGFRPGKAPRNVIERMHGERIRYEVAQKLISSSLNDVIKENSLDIVGDPKIDISSFDPGQELTFQANISLFPSPQISGYESFSVEAEKREVSDSHVDEALERVREQRADFRKLEFRDTAEDGDVIEGEMQVKVEGQAEAERSEPLVAQLGDGRLPAELEAGVIGMKVGESKSIPVSFPEDHADESLRGKSGSYEVTLNALHERTLPDLDDEFAKSSGLGVETILELRLKVRENLEKEFEAEAKGNVHAKILEVLLEKNDFSVPQIMVDEEIRSLISRSGMVDPNKIDMSKIPVEAFREQMGESAAKRVKTAVIVDRIAELEGITVEDGELESSYQEVADSNGLPLDEVKKFFQDPYRRSGFIAEQVRNKTLDFLHERAKVKYVQPAAEDDSQKDAKKKGKKPKKESKKQ